MLAQAVDAPLFGRLVWMLRWRYAAITASAYVFSITQLDSKGDWQFFVRGSELLFGQHRLHSLLPGGLKLYANYPEMQFGPLSLVLATPFRLFGENSRGAVAVVLTAALPALIYLLERTARATRPITGDLGETALAGTVLIGGMFLAPAWSLLGTSFAHIDDVIVLATSCGALWAIAHRRWDLVGVLLGLGVAAKPWGVIAFPLLLAAPGRARWRPMAGAFGIAAAAWLPFVIADHYTLSAIRPNTDVSPASVIHLFGVSLDHIPGWTRPVQLAASLIVGAIAVSRGRWAGVLAVGIAARLILDPGTWGYYSAGMILAALAWDLLRSGTPMPFWTVATFAMLDLTTGFDSSVQAGLRLAVTSAMIAVITLGRRDRADVQGDLARPSSRGRQQVADDSR